MEILNDVFNSVSSYFNTLTQFGYKKQSDVNKLLIYVFISELLTGDMRYFITEEDYKLINRALTCLYGSSCLIPYPKYINDDSLFGHINDEPIVPRITEKGDRVRYTESDVVRFKASNYNE